MSAYGQFCPVSKAMELLDERWTMPVVRELLLGSRHFNELRWIPQLGDEDLDPHLLMRDMHRNVDLPAVPEGRTVVRFRFRDARAPARDWWLLITPDAVDLCDFDPGLPEHAAVDTDIRTLTMVWRGDLGWAEALRWGRVQLHGPGWACRGLPRWLGQSPLAAGPRPAAVAAT